MTISVILDKLMKGLVLMKRITIKYPMRGNPLTPFNEGFSPLMLRAFEAFHKDQPSLKEEVDPLQPLEGLDCNASHGALLDQKLRTHRQVHHLPDSQKHQESAPVEAFGNGQSKSTDSSHRPAYEQELHWHFQPSPVPKPVALPRPFVAVLGGLYRSIKNLFQRNKK